MRISTDLAKTAVLAAIVINGALTGIARAAEPESFYPPPGAKIAEDRDSRLEMARFDYWLNISDDRRPVSSAEAPKVQPAIRIRF